MNKEQRREFKRQVQSWKHSVVLTAIREAQVISKEIRHQEYANILYGKPLTTWDILDLNTNRLISKPIHWDKGPSIFTERHIMEAK